MVDPVAIRTPNGVGEISSDWTGTLPSKVDGGDVNELNYQTYTIKLPDGTDKRHVVVMSPDGHSYLEQELIEGDKISLLMQKQGEALEIDPAQWKKFPFKEVLSPYNAVLKLYEPKVPLKERVITHLKYLGESLKPVTDRLSRITERAAQYITLKTTAHVLVGVAGFVFTWLLAHPWLLASMTKTALPTPEQPSSQPEPTIPSAIQPEPPTPATVPEAPTTGGWW